MVFIRTLSCMCLLGATHAQQCSGGAGQKFVDANDARCRMEKMLDSYVSLLEERYADIDSDEGVDDNGESYAGVRSSCVGNGYAGVVSCSPDSNVWSHQSYQYNEQFVNPLTNSCTRFDKTDDQLFIKEPLTGRKTSCERRNECKEDRNDDCSGYPYFIPGTDNRGGNSEECRCNYQTAYKDGSDWKEHNDIESKNDYLERTGCISPDEIGECTVSMDNFGISLPENTEISDSRVASEICGTNILVNKFKEESEKNPDSGWHFMGFQKSGMYRIWPSVYECRTEAQCSGCSDPRYRGWYANAASGPKDVVMVLDDSGSMQEFNRVEKLKEAAGWVINTLGAHDYVSVVRFTSGVDAFSDELVKANLEGRAALKEWINLNFYASGGTNIGGGLQKAFDIFESSGTRSSNCEKIILLLTDGKHDPGTLDPEDVIAQRNTADVNARIFTYAFGGDGDNPLDIAQMKFIACANRGVFHQVLDEDSDNLKAIMAGYFTIMAAGVDEGAVRWASWYEDGEGLGMYGGACRAVYDRYKEELQGVPVMFGVTCVGVARPTFEDLSGSDITWNQIQEDNKKCADTSSLDFNAMEILRRNIHSNSVCRGAVTIDDSGKETWTPPPDDEEDGSNLAVIIGAVAGVLVCIIAALGAKSFCSNGGGASSQKGKIEPSAPPPTTQGQVQAIPQGQVVAVY